MSVVRNGWIFLLLRKRNLRVLVVVVNFTVVRLLAIPVGWTVGVLTDWMVQCKIGC